MILDNFHQSIHTAFVIMEICEEESFQGIFELVSQALVALFVSLFGEVFI